MLAHPVLKEIDLLLCSASRIIDLYQDQDIQFTDQAMHWLKNCEDKLRDHGIAASSQIAGLRARVISAGRGVVASDLQFLRRSSSRKSQEAVAELAVRQAIEITLTATERDRNSFANAGEIARQLVALAASKGQLPGQRVNGDAALAPDLTTTWSLLTQDSQSHDATVHISGLVGFQQALILIAEELQNLAQQPA